MVSVVVLVLLTKHGAGWGEGGGGVLCIESYFPFDLHFNPLFDMFF